MKGLRLTTYLKEGSLGREEGKEEEEEDEDEASRFTTYLRSDSLIR